MKFTSTVIIVASLIAPFSSVIASKTKKGKKDKNNKPSPPLPANIEGDYLYKGCNDNIFKVTIGCGLFGKDDPDLCMYEETKIGTSFDEEKPGSFLLEGTDQFFLPFEPFAEGIEGVDDEKLCVIAGSFRASATIKKGNIKPIPLATSNGCKNVAQNFAFFVKGKVAEDGKLKLLFSTDSGATYPDAKDAREALKGGDQESSRRLLDDRHPDVLDVRHRDLFFCSPFCGSLLKVVVQAAAALCDAVLK